MTLSIFNMILIIFFRLYPLIIKIMCTSKKTFEHYERYFFYEILILIKSKNINVCCFFLTTRTTIFITEKIV